VRDPFALNERLFALYYPILTGLSERAGHRELRQSLIREATGRTLEVGAGSGLNLPHYTSDVSELVINEPSPHMQRRIRDELRAHPPAVGSWELVGGGGEDLPFPDESFDTVTATYVHCTIPDPARALREFTRVLRPGGRYVFLEHVHAGEGTALGRLQNLVELPHTYIAAGCHPNRDTEALLAGSPFELERLEHGEMPRAFPTVRPIIYGVAARPD
jgi:SAM-dependent methyltransferase